MTDRTQTPLLTIVEELFAAAQTTFQRRLLVISGGSENVIAAASAIWQGFAINSRIWVGDAPVGVSETLLATHALKMLGSEQQLIVFNAWSGFHPDAFCALAGTLVGGGVFILLTPPLQQWPSWADPDYSRLLPYGYSPENIGGRLLWRIVQALRNCEAIVRWDAEAQCVISQMPSSVLMQGSDFTPREVDTGMATSDAFDQKCMATDRSAFAIAQQNSHLQRLTALAEKAPVPIVITADRGRGKSALLGRLAAHWKHQCNLEIVITAANPQAAAQARRWAEHEAKSIGRSGCTLSFVPPDALLLHPHAVDAIFIDEAAMLPLSVLQQLLLRYPRVVLASTVHGYEGSGRGLAIKLFPWLAREKPGWQAITLTAPMRWCEGDPLEQWLIDTFCLGDDVVELTKLHTEWRVRTVSANELAIDSTLLHQVFGLLVAAHYRTTPSDLRDLLDGPNLKLWVLQRHEQVAGVCLVALEGPIGDPSLCDAILAGKRRPRGHLLPQTIAYHCHSPITLLLHCARVVRIAIAPSLQGRGWGSRLLSGVENDLCEQQVQIFGTSFAVEPPVLNFWLKAGMQVLRIGATRESASGLPSCLMAKALPNMKEASELVGNELSRLAFQFRSEAPTVLPVLTPGLSHDTVSALQLGKGTVGTQTCGMDTAVAGDDIEVVDARVYRFASGAMPFESALGALQRVWLQVEQQLALSLPNQNIGDLLVGRCTLNEFAKLHGLAGRDAAIQWLREIFMDIHAFSISNHLP